MVALRWIHTWRWPLALLLALGVWLLIQPMTALACGGGIICVDADATGPDHNGISWTTAYTNVQDALAVAVSGDEIWVAEGVYYPDEGSEQTKYDRASTFTLRDGVALYGGFAGYGVSETVRTQRDWTAHVTVLSGDIDGNDVNDDDNGIAETWNDIVGNNAYHVLWLDGVTYQSITGATVIDGFTITAGNAADGSPNRGGGLYCIGGSGRECNPTLAHVTFSGNRAGAGGGMFNFGYPGVSSPTLTDVTFSGNLALYSGGGMYNYGRDGGVSSPTLTDVVFNGNVADDGDGGGIGVEGYAGVSSPTLTNVTFSDNFARYNGGGMLNTSNSSGVSNPTLTNVNFYSNTAGEYGGGMYNAPTNSSESNPILTNVVFSGNLATGDGGGFYSESYAAGRVSNPTLNYVTFYSNTAHGRGGGMANYSAGSGVESNPLLTNVSFYSNTANNGGGGMFNYGAEMWSGGSGKSNPTLINVIFSGNSTESSGGGMYNENYDGLESNAVLTNVLFNGNVANGEGGGMANASYGSVDTNNPVLTNVTFSGNRAYRGGAMSNIRMSTGTSNPTLVNCILWGNAAFTDPQIYNYRGGFAVTYSDVQGGHTGTGNNNANPQFVAPIAASSAPTTTGNYRLREDSPAIDAGDPATCPPDDLDDQPRADLRCDMGAYERQYRDGDTVIKSDFTGGTPYSFGPTWVSMTLSAENTGSVTVTKHLTPPGGVWDTGEISVTWWISSSLSAGFSAMLSLCYTDDEVAGLNESRLAMFRWNGSAWVDQNATPDPDNNCVTLSGVTGFSAWTLKDTSVGATTPTAARVAAVAARGFAPVAALPLVGLLVLGGAAVLRRRRR